MNGTPTLGSGRIYPVDKADFVVAPFVIPPHWPQAYGLDVGWRRTAAVWVALDRDNDVAYFTSEHYAGEAIPAVHADAIKARGAWIPGVVDPAARGRSQIDGGQLIELYKACGLDIEAANNSVEAGIYAIWQRLLSGKLKVFASCSNWLDEYAMYRRDDKGHVVKTGDHAQDAGRYAIMSGLARAIAAPSAARDDDFFSGFDTRYTG